MAARSVFQEKPPRHATFPRDGRCFSRSGQITGRSRRRPLSFQVPHVPCDFPRVVRITLWCHLQLPLPLTVRTCRCGRPLDANGHHRAACARVGCWVDEGVGGASVGKQEAVSQPMLSCVIWTSTNRMARMAGNWKLSSMGCLCSEVPSWRWTQHPPWRWLCKKTSC